MKNDVEILLEQEKRNLNFWHQISTEIRTSLGQIASVTNELKHNFSETEKMIEQLDEIEFHSESIYSIANSIVDYAYLSQNKLEIYPDSVSIKDVMSHLFLRLSRLADRKKIHLFTNVHDVEDICVVVDRARLEQVIQCYTQYAIEHSVTDGNLFIMLHYEVLSQNKVALYVDIQISRNDGTLSFDCKSVMQGTGEQDEYQGNGINLYVCGNILKQMGGKIECISNTEFANQIRLSFELPKMMHDAVKEKTVETFKKARILIFDADRQWNYKNNIFFEKTGIRYDIVQEWNDLMDCIGQAEHDYDPYSICILKWKSVNSDTEKVVREIRQLYGKEMILIAISNNEADEFGINKMEGLNYFVKDSMIRSLVFDTLVKLNKGEMLNIETHHYQKYHFENRRVLLAEDVILNAEIITKMLKKVHISVTAVVNGFEAVSVFKKKPEGYFNCILMDVNMPVLDGYLAAKEIRNSKRSDAKTVPILAMTANALPEDIKEAMDAGMDGHISKPVDAKKLYALLDQTFHSIEEDQFLNLKQQTEELERKNKELRSKAEHDYLTGLLNRHGFISKVEQYKKSDQSVGLMIVDLDKFKEVNDVYGHQIGDRVLKKMALTLQKYFRATDEIVRMGGDEFAVVLTDVSPDRSFVVKNIEKMNQELLHPTDGLPAFTISTGVAFSENGYSENLYHNADEALYLVKETGRCGCKIYTEDEIQTKRVRLESGTHNGEAVLYLEKDGGRLISGKNYLTNLVLTNNRAIGTVCGFYKDELPIYFISKYTLDQIGYTMEEFMSATGGNFEKIIYPYDLLCMYQSEDIGKVYDAILRLIHKNKTPIWFHAVSINTYSNDGQKMWIGSFRQIDTSLLRELCETDASVVGMISCLDEKIVFEKGIETLPGYSIEKNMKYDYDAMLQFSITKNIAEAEREKVYKKSCMSFVKQQLKQMNTYYFGVKRVDEEGREIPVKYGFRYLNDQHDAIVCTQEIM